MKESKDGSLTDSADQEIREMTNNAGMALSSSMLKAEQIMTCALDDELTEQAPSTSAAIQMTPLLLKNYYTNDWCVAPSKRDTRVKSQHPIELCRSLTPISLRYPRPATEEVKQCH